MNNTKKLAQLHAKKLAIEVFKLENLLVRAADMYQYNFDQYPDEKPTMIGAINEILDEIKSEANND